MVVYDKNNSYYGNSNTTLVKVKCLNMVFTWLTSSFNSNTTLVKVKYNVLKEATPVEAFKYNTC